MAARHVVASYEIARIESEEEDGNKIKREKTPPPRQNEY